MNSQCQDLKLLIWSLRATRQMIEGGLNRDKVSLQKKGQILMSFRKGKQTIHQFTTFSFFLPRNLLLEPLYAPVTTDRVS